MSPVCMAVREIAEGARERFAVRGLASAPRGFRSRVSASSRRSTRGDRAASPRRWRARARRRAIAREARLHAAALGQPREDEQALRRRRDGGEHARKYSFRARCARIALLTDFGTRDPYVAAMKGVIASRCEARIDDLTHEIAPFDVWEAAFFLRDVVAYWPAGTIFVCVVDPGVGTARRILAVESDGRIFLAPDNGVAAFRARGADAFDGDERVVLSAGRLDHISRARSLRAGGRGDRERDAHRRARAAHRRSRARSTTRPARSSASIASATASPTRSAGDAVRGRSSTIGASMTIRTTYSGDGAFVDRRLDRLHRDLRRQRQRGSRSCSSAAAIASRSFRNDG